VLLNVARLKPLFFPFSMKKLQTKLSLNKQTLSVLTAREQNNVRGGQLAPEDGGDGGENYFTSIGCTCSKRHGCDRTLTNPC